MEAKSFLRGAFYGVSRVWDWSTGSLRVALYGRFHLHAAHTRTRRTFLQVCIILGSHQLICYGTISHFEPSDKRIRLDS